MSKFNVTFVPQLNRKPETVNAEDVSAVSDYTVQFNNAIGQTILVLGGVERVELVGAESKPNLATIDTTGKPASTPCGTIEGHPCQANGAISPASPAATPPSGGWPKVAPPVNPPH